MQYECLSACQDCNVISESLVYNLPRCHAMQSTPPTRHVLEISSGEARGEVHQWTTQEWIYHLGIIGFNSKEMFLFRFQLHPIPDTETNTPGVDIFASHFTVIPRHPGSLHRSVGEEELQGQLRWERWISHDQIFAFGKDRWISLGQLVKAHLELVPSVKWQENVFVWIAKCFKTRTTMNLLMKLLRTSNISVWWFLMVFD